MRFKKIKPFKVDELLLDEDNYRFKAAANQKACVEKIFLGNTQYFRNLLTSVAEDDLGEPLLVYEHKGENIVLDGNRRLAALKVLSNPKKYAPNEAIREHAEHLLSLHKVETTGIQAQVSSDKQLIFKTVYERHAAGQGKSRIAWSAYGAARFRYDQQMEDGNDWYPLALLLETEKKLPKWTNYIDSSEFSYEVFRRIFRAALDKEVISRNLFSERHKRIKTSVDKQLIKDAITKVDAFLTSMEHKDLSLSRKGKYADKASVDDYISKFSLSPDNARSQAPTGKKSGKPSTNASNSGASNSGAGSPNPASNSNTSNPTDKKSYGIDQSSALVTKLKALGSEKLIRLYSSLCTVSLYQHPQLLYVGAWSFFETISSLAGRKDDTSFLAYFGSLIKNNPAYTKQKKKDLHETLEDISKKGNLNKHSGEYHSTSGYQLRADFAILEPFILDTIDTIIANKSKKAAS